MTERDFQSVVERFRLRGKLTEVATLKTGHIHDTYVLTIDEGRRRARYVLQRINHEIFKDPPRMMTNIIRVTAHIHALLSRRDPTLADRQLSVILTNDGEGCFKDAGGSFWRVYNFIENAATCDIPESAGQAREAARMFGCFQRMLLDLPEPPLYETIPGFHDTSRRLAVFQEVVRADTFNRARHAKSEIDFVFENAAICGVLPGLVNRGEFPIRIAHNDTKINNVMLDQQTGRGVCVIDLDTVMPGLSLHDFGDLVRTAACPAAEDEQDLSKIRVDLGLFEALAQGFVQETKGFLMPAERRHLVFAGKLITFEQLIRFLTDYLAGDAYYKVRRDRHNLDRSRTQMQLVKSITALAEPMNELVERAFANTPEPTM